MSKPSSSRFLVRSFHHIATKPSTTINPKTITGISHFITTNPKPLPNSSLSSFLSRTQRTHFSTSPNLGKVNPHPKLLPRKDFTGFRYFSFKNHEMGSKNFAQKLFKKPTLSIKSAFMRYKEAVVLQIEAFWKRNYLFVIGAAGVVACILLWRVLFGIASTFISFSEGMAKYGFLAFSSAVVAFTGMYLRARYTVNPDKVYRMAMRRLNTSASILEVMGAPLTGTDLRAYVMSGGGINLKNFRPSLRSKRCFLIFPIQGSERKGLVSVEVKKKKGQHEMKLLAVDVPLAQGQEQRLFLIGDEEEYRIGNGLISVLRDPVVKALAAAKEFEARDEKEDEEDEERELVEAERKRQEEIENLEKSKSQ